MFVAARDHGGSWLTLSVPSFELPVVVRLIGSSAAIDPCFLAVAADPKWARGSWNVFIFAQVSCRKSSAGRSVNCSTSVRDRRVVQHKAPAVLLLPHGHRVPTLHPQVCKVCFCMPSCSMRVAAQSHFGNLGKAFWALQVARCRGDVVCVLRASRCLPALLAGPLGFLYLRRTVAQELERGPDETLVERVLQLLPPFVRFQAEHERWNAFCGCVFVREASRSTGICGCWAAVLRWQRMLALAAICTNVEHL